MVVASVLASEEVEDEVDLEVIGPNGPDLVFKNFTHHYRPVRLPLQPPVLPWNDNIFVENVSHGIFPPKATRVIAKVFKILVFSNHGREINRG